MTEQKTILQPKEERFLTRLDTIYETYDSSFTKRIYRGIHILLQKKLSIYAKVCEFKVKQQFNAETGMVHLHFNAREILVKKYNHFHTYSKCDRQQSVFMPIFGVILAEYRMLIQMRERFVSWRDIERTQKYVPKKDDSTKVINKAISAIKIILQDLETEKKVNSND